ncbi:Beta-1,3-galactosyltransferase 6 [Halotydeus destructor]|nr:Beta-1,3-galactosyltransferase 6 [Halotydeus destructor]
MHFVVKKPQQTIFNFNSYRDFERKGFKWLIVLAFVGSFSSGLLIGLIANFDTSTLSTSGASAGSLVNPCHENVTLKEKKDETHLVILILSAKQFRDRRDAIRESWLNLVGGRRVKHFFAIGTLELDSNDLEQLATEKEQFGDLLLFPQVKDTYSGLSHKLLASIRALNSRNAFHFMMKVDDDSFVRVDALFDELVQREDSTKLYWGYFAGNSQVKKAGKWSERTWFLCDTYLPYAVGGGYVLSSDLVNYVATNGHLLQLYNNEDVSLGTWLAPLDINRHHDQRFDTWWKSRGCSNDFLITHKQSPADMRLKYTNLQTTGKLCLVEKFISGHEYDWKALPSKCCSKEERLFKSL